MRRHQTRLFCVNYILRNKAEFPLQSEIGKASFSFSKEEIQSAIKGKHLNLKLCQHKVPSKCA